MYQYPVNLDLAGRKVLLVGGGNVAYRKLRELILAAAEITLVSPLIIAEVAELLEKEKIKYLPRKFVAEDLAACFLVIVATDDQTVNAEVSRLALAENKLINVVDNASLSNFTVPAKARRGDLLLTAATAGKLPALSREIRKRLEQAFGEEYAVYLKLLGELRPLIIERIGQERRREIFNRLADFELIALLKEDKSMFKEKIREILPEELAGQLGDLFGQGLF